MMGRSSASIVAGLLQIAKQRGDDPNLVINRFGLERMLHRLSVSEHADRFLLKGALLFSLWYEQPHRPTRDADLLGFGSDDIESLVKTFRDVVAMGLDDGIVFDADSVRADAIREDNAYGGVRVRFVGRIGNTRCPLQVDVGFGDAVTPPPRHAALPTLLPGFSAPKLKVYPVYSVISEKYHAMVLLGLANSRMKDYFDLCVIARRTELDGALLADAIAATFARRETDVPRTTPIAITGEFAAAKDKQRQWASFLERNRLDGWTLERVVDVLHRLLWPPTEVAVARSRATARWLPATLEWGP
jgi:hypothetical protein